MFSQPEREEESVCVICYVNILGGPPPHQGHSRQVSDGLRSYVVVSLSTVVSWQYIIIVVIIIIFYTPSGA